MVEYSDKQTLIVQRLDGTTYDLEAEGIRVVTFDPPSPNVQHTFAQVGHYGGNLTNTVIQQTTIPLTFDVVATDNYDYELQRLKVLEIFDTQQPFYIVNTRIPYLRWKVVAEAFNYPRLNNYWKAKSVAINLVCIGGYAETSVTSLHLFDNDGTNVGFGLGLERNKLPSYSFSNQTNLTFNNIGNIPLLADERPVTITFKGTVDKELAIINNSTGQTFKYLKPLTANNTLKIIGLIPMVDGVQRLGGDYSSHSYLDFVVGNNNLVISGAKDFTISFETRFYY